MLRCNVHNLVTGQRYEFTAADQAEIDARLERKASVYGRDAWTETIPAWTQTGVWSTDDPPVFDPLAVIEHPEQVIDHPSEREVTVTEIDQRPERIAAAWAAANTFAEAGMDANSRTSLLWLAMDPACPVWRRDRILAVQLWWSAVWSHYAWTKQQIQAGVDTNFDPAIPGACPWTIWQIAASEP